MSKEKVVTCDLFLSLTHCRLERVSPLTDYSTHDYYTIDWTTPIRLGKNEIIISSMHY